MTSRGRRTSSAHSPGDVRRLEITGTLDRHAAEALVLEIRRLARRYGIEVAAVRVETREPRARRVSRAPARRG